MGGLAPDSLDAVTVNAESGIPAEFAPSDEVNVLITTYDYSKGKLIRLYAGAKKLGESFRILEELQKGIKYIEENNLPTVKFSFSVNPKDHVDGFSGWRSSDSNFGQGATAKDLALVENATFTLYKPIKTTKGGWYGPCVDDDHPY